jgi:hypothetical protein
MNRQATLGFLGLLALQGLGCEHKAAPDPTPTQVVASASAVAVATPPPPPASTPGATGAAPEPSAAPSVEPHASAPAVKASGKPATTGAPKPASKHIDGSHFALDVASPGCLAGQDCSMTIKLAATGDYHVNKEYPFKFIGAPSSGLTFLGKSEANIFTRAAGDYVPQGEKAGLMTVRFKAGSAGDTRVTGKYKLSVCSDAQCQIEEQAVELPLSVM